MKTGLKSLLFGVHQFLFHPITVWRGWVFLYKEYPSFWECVAIFFHDFGYAFCDRMDDEKGENHPYFGARLVFRMHQFLLPAKHKERLDLFYLMLYHSRYLSARHEAEPSKLCWADKLSPKYDPPWFYIRRARLSGEIKEYRLNAVEKFPASASDYEWYIWLQKKCEEHAVCKQKASHRGKPPVSIPPPVCQER